MAGKPQPLLRKFWTKVEIGGEGCWEWRASLTPSGYGAIRIRGQRRSAHRLVWELFYRRTIPDGLCVCHKCDNRICVRPSHLFLGTIADNTYDMIAKGRMRSSRPGEMNCKAKLTTEQVLQIRDLYATGDLSQQQIADRYGMSQTGVSTIVRGAGWKHL